MPKGGATGLAAALFIATPLSIPASAKDDPKTACMTAALMDYTRADLALSQREASPVGTVEGTIARRRLQEQYCLRSTRCLIGEPTSQITGMTFAVEFEKCLDEEAAEKAKLK
jgi:hypothetical protein